MKAKVLTACAVPGASVAAVAQAHGLNANLVHKWRRVLVAKEPSSAPVAEPVTPTSVPTDLSFVPIGLPPREPPADIRIEVRRGATTVAITWPSHAGSECAAWLREWIR